MSCDRRQGLLFGWILASLLAACSGVSTQTGHKEALSRDDGATHVETELDGSLQNPAWSPDGRSLLITRFDNGYNREPSDLYTIDLSSHQAAVLVADGNGNVNLPGSSWHEGTGKIVFSSSRDPHDEIFIIDERGKPGDEENITYREAWVSYEPSFSPDGEWIVFESHVLDVEGNGVVTKFRIDGSAPYEALTGEEGDARQPNWSPAGDLILYQSFFNDQWEIWVMNADGSAHRQITRGLGNKTDASFSPDGQWIVYSHEGPGEDNANLYIVPLFEGEPTRVTYFEGYDGAPSWSPDGKQIAFESYPGDPDDSEGTTIWIIDVPLRR